MKNKLFLIILLLFRMSIFFAMNYVPCDYFSQLPNIHKRSIIYTLLEEGKTINDAHNILVTIGLLSRQTYEQTKCPFFMRDIVKFISSKHHISKGAAAKQLKTAGSKKYKKRGEALVLASQTNRLNYKFYNKTYPLLDQGVDVNFCSLQSNTTPLMNAVKSNIPKLVHFFISHGANVNDCDVQKRSARFFNIIYDKHKLRLTVQTLKDAAREVELRNQHNPDKIKLYDHLDNISAFSELFNALRIDKMLENERAFPVVEDDENPLLVLLKEEPILSKIIKCAFNFDKREWSYCIPSNISRNL